VREGPRQNSNRTVLNEILGSVRTELKAVGRATTSGQAEGSAGTWVPVMRLASSWIDRWENAQCLGIETAALVAPNPVMDPWKTTPGLPWKFAPR